LDFSDRGDLHKWLARTFTGEEARRLGYTHHFVTYNDTRIEALEKK
jgi:hypothetical protein